MQNNIVRYDSGRFYGWPANNGIWSWGNEIALGFTRGIYQDNIHRHSIDREKPRDSVIARSLDGGKSWCLEEPENFPEGFSFGKVRSPGGEVIDEPIDFTHPDLAIRCRGNGLLVSYDRCRTWRGPYAFGDFNFRGILTARTDYIVNGKRDCHFLLAVSGENPPSENSDRAFAARTVDGGKTFELLGWMLPGRRDIRNLMPSTVRVSDVKLVSALRVRLIDEVPSGGKLVKKCWIEATESLDNGKTWRSLGKVADTQPGESRRSGNPPSLIQLRDERLCAVYGYRAQPFGIRAKISSDEGRSWGEEIILRDDARTYDMGYVRSTVRNDGKVVSVYYFTTEKYREQHIEATIWHPDEFQHFE